LKPYLSSKKWLEKKAKRGVGAYPLGTVAFYGPDNRRGSKAAVNIVPFPGAEPIDLRRWFAEAGDVRTDASALAEIVAFLREYEVRSVAMLESLLGCPHEEGIDYPRGEACRQCPYWAGRNRWADALSGR
jgi:hypothetical protein